MRERILAINPYVVVVVATLGVVLGVMSAEYLTKGLIVIPIFISLLGCIFTISPEGDTKYLASKTLEVFMEVGGCLIGSIVGAAIGSGTCDVIGEEAFWTLVGAIAGMVAWFSLATAVLGYDVINGDTGLTADRFYSCVLIFAFLVSCAAICVLLW